MRAILLVLLAAPAFAQSTEKAVRARLELQRNDESDRKIFNKQFGPNLHIIEFGKTIDLDACEIDSAGRMSRDPKHAEVWALVQAHAKEAGLLDGKEELRNLLDIAKTPWTPVGIKGKAIRVKYDSPRQAAQARQFGQAAIVWDKTFLIDRKGVIFAEMDSEHFREGTHQPNEKAAPVKGG